MDVKQRNERARTFVNDMLLAAKSCTEKDFFELSKDKALKKILDDLIFVKANGFRGIVLTAIVGLHLNADYDPVNDFYGCNPRSIFEQGIWYALRDNGIPSGKSDPLNVAKNISVLDENWAKGRRPQSAATAVVDFLRILTAANAKKHQALIDYFFYQLQLYAKTVASIEIDVALSSNDTFKYAEKIAKFTLEFPEAGTIPQYVIGKLLHYLNVGLGTKVHGVDESVFGTNTTSKKPADIWITKDNEITKLYEITVKKIDTKRLEDCIDALIRMKISDKPLIFICRVPQDSSPVLRNSEGLATYKNKDFYVVDISSFIFTSFALLQKMQVDNFMNDLIEFIQDVNRPISTKEGWKTIFSN